MAMTSEERAVTTWSGGRDGARGSTGCDSSGRAGTTYRARTACGASTSQAKEL